MATYKVIQDIEAEDKLLGPLTLRQFIYAAVSAVLFYLSFLAFTKHAAFMLVVFVPLALVSGFFAWPWGRDQPTEIWALAKVRFLLKPHKRIWDQNGAKELVTVTAPKKIEAVYSNNLSEAEVESRLKALAETIDSRGWAVKNVNVNLYSQPQMGAPVNSDRLISMASLPQVVPEVDIQATDDMLEESNPVARQFDTMMAASAKAHRDEIISQLRAPAAPQANAGVPSATGQPSQQPASQYWFMAPPASSISTPQNAVTFNTQLVTPVAAAPTAANPPQPAASAITSADEAALLAQLHAEEAREQDTGGHWHTVQPLSAASTPAAGQQQTNAGSAAQPATAASAQPPVTPAPNPAILQLASNDDLNVATIAREANKRNETPPDEVVISLH